MHVPGYFNWLLIFAAGLSACVTLAIGLAVGVWLARKGRAPSDKPLDEHHLHKLLRSLFHWTDGFANDMSHYRKMVDSLKGQIRVVEQQSPDADPASMLRLLSRIVQANDLLQQRLDNAEKTLKDQADEISSYMSEARTDTLTGLPNRRVFDEELSARLARHRRDGCPLSVLIIDIDHFKKFNDRYGHLAGDAVLVQVASVLRETMRETDIPVRLGGEEFAVLLADSEIGESAQAAERLRIALEASVFHYEARPLHVTISGGVANALGDEDAKCLVNRADQALYASKAAGRNCMHWHNGRDCISISAPKECGVHGAAELVVPQREARREEYSRLCDAVRQRLLDVVRQPLDELSPFPSAEEVGVSGAGLSPSQWCDTLTARRS